MRIVSRAIFALALLCFGAGLAWSAGTASFTAAAFEAAQKADKPILIHVSATWCPTCKAQMPIVNGLASESRFSGLQVFEVDFDSQKDVLRQFGVRQQSTLIVFKGAIEKGRSIGDTDKASIEALAAKGL
jgi:thioredoxin 1